MSKASTSVVDKKWLFYAMFILAHVLSGKGNGDIDIWQTIWTDENYQHFAVDKMRFTKSDETESSLPIRHTSSIRPYYYWEHSTKAYEYVVNGNQVIEWIMERYAVNHRQSILNQNDPNNWSREQWATPVIFSLIYSLSVIMLSCQTVDIVNTLPILRDFNFIISDFRVLNSISLLEHWL